MTFCVWLGCAVAANFFSPADAGTKKTVGVKKNAPIFTKSGELTSSDEKDTHRLLKGSSRKVFSIQLAAGKVYQIDLQSKDFDAVLRLEDSAGKEVAFNDDGSDPKSLDARIYYKPSAAGQFKIIATSLRARLGKFVLTVTEADNVASASFFKSEPMELKMKDGKATYQGSLQERDGLAFGRYFKVFTIQLEAGKTYRIDQTSQDFDALLILEDAHGNRLAEDDDSGDGGSARIVNKTVSAGVYRIIATTFPARKTGRFEIRVSGIIK